MAKNVSNNFKNIIKNGGPFYSYAVMTLADGTVIELSSENDFTISGSGYSEDSESGFPLGSALSKAITLNLDNTVTPEPLQDTVSDDILDTQNDEILTERKSKNYDYYYARIVLYTEADLPDGTTERIQEGIFTVIDSVTPGDVLEINAYDDMYKADVEFTSSLTYPVSAQMLLNEVCSKCDITLGSATFKNNNFQIQQAPEGLTGRQVIGYIAQIAGGNAVIDSTGHLVIKSYDFSAFDVKEDVTAGEVETDSGIHIISEYTSDPDIGTDDITITGVSVTIESEDSDEEDETYIVGSEEYAISVDNPLITGQEKTAIDLIAESIIGITIRPFSGDFMPDPTVEFMDLAYVVDRNDVIYKTFITTHDFNYLGSSTFSCGVESPERHGSSYYSTASEAYQKAKNDIKVNKTQWEQAIENLSQQVANASGLYTTEETQPDGSTIFYMHNKPALEESDIVWKMTAETLTVSTDGGHSWNAGITVNGEVIARIMNTIGINFDWGVGGTLIVQDEDGNQTAYIDAETGTVRFAVESLTITGKTVQEIASEQSETAINDFVDAVYNPDITNLQAQIDGQIETWFYNYIPTTDNYPASEWTTDTERDKHLGDLFYVVDNTDHGGEAYRWAKINNVYTWDYVEDTAVTKALADAAAAQDTADQKRRVFVTQPYPPYDVGDLWVGDDTSEMMRCQRARTSGSYVASDWIKAVKYTDDSELYNFVQNDYNETIKELYNSVDQKSETWYQATDPALEWTEIESTPLQDTTGANILDTAGETIITILEKEKSLHNGDLWKNSTTNKEYLYQNGEWVEMPIPDEVFDMIDGKAQIFVVKPTPPYDVGDVWFTGTTILVCNTKRENGSFSESDWGKKDNYTDDSALYEFIEGDYSKTVENLKNQADKKAETWYQSTDPSTGWTAAEKQTHTGDLWYNTSDEKTYIYNGSAWELTKTTPPDEVFDAIDGKAQIFVSQPKPPYSVGDLWFNSATSDIMTCINSRSTGNYTASDWQKRNKYTDDSAVDNLDESLNQQEVFDRLTNGGTVQGIYMENGQLYILFSYAKGGTLTLGGVNNENGILEIQNSSGDTIGRWTNSGFVTDGKYFAVNSNGNVYTDDPRISGTLFMVGTVSAGLVSNSDRAKSSAFTLWYRTSSGATTGQYSMHIGNPDDNWEITNIRSYPDEFEISGNLTVYGEKSRIIETDNYGSRLQYCYEMPTPMFGDVGEGVTDENGECLIFIDDVFAETVSTKNGYHVFLQKEGNGDLWIDEKKPLYFIVKGTPNLTFAWEIKVKQKEYEYKRLDEHTDNVGTIDASKILNNDIEEFIREKEMELI